MLTYLPSHHVALCSQNASLLVLSAAVTYAPKGMLSRLPQLPKQKLDSGIKVRALCMHHAHVQEVEHYTKLTTDCSVYLCINLHIAEITCS